MRNPPEKNTGSKRTKSLLREYTEAIGIAILLALFIRAFVVQAFKIPSGSMKTTLLIGDHILVNKFVYGIRLPILNKEILHFSNPKRRDIIVFQYPVDPSKDFIKRVIGEPGDTVKIIDKKVYVNDQPLDEPYTVFTDPKIQPAGVSPRDNMGPVAVPPDSLFVMGDNRDESYDSRFWKFVKLDALRGEAFIIYCSWNQDGELSLSSSESYIRWNRIGKLLH
ncbi:signal peptidase I [Syntrophobacter fumaroxidans]|uniref:Signal peptidase I n=1 Tax=Syntrophobacter fumaroxidans (strain DSM 10017 / MPOB) TaxID=335543 RepID=A0LFN3_SYNFM|nr:signal peptidase I [Syntrophobacter fumaroxidans]ABK16235.1 signal peptidase I. Serine peptidase. MEROPS family S26A [Syntrophobacter fumaroxidans MPOB]HOI95133.1 signal peptidase I [Syntrophobacter fumaroxidans]